MGLVQNQPLDKAIGLGSSKWVGNPWSVGVWSRNVFFILLAYAAGLYLHHRRASGTYKAMAKACQSSTTQNIFGDMVKRYLKHNQISANQANGGKLQHINPAESCILSKKETKNLFQENK